MCHSSELLMYHDYKVHGNLKYYPCPFCSKLNSKPGNWENHLKIRHTAIYAQGIRHYDDLKFSYLTDKNILFKEDHSLPENILEYLKGPPHAAQPKCEEYEIAIAIGR